MLETKEATLSPQVCGGDVLAMLAKGRHSGVLQWGMAGKAQQLVFVLGRPESGCAIGEETTTDPKQVIALLRSYAITARGPYQWAPEANPVPPAHSLQIDTLGEVMLAWQQAPTVLVDSVVATRSSLKLLATPLFAKFAAAWQQITGLSLVLPVGHPTLAAVIQNADPGVVRGFVTLMILGGLVPDKNSNVVDPHKKSEPTVTQASSSKEPPNDAANQIDLAHARMSQQNYYEFLNVDAKATHDHILQAFYEMAKRWHADRLRHLDLTDVQKKKASELFIHLEEAKRILTTPESRKNYDWQLAQKTAGLPTDVSAIMKAESSFEQGKAFVLHGKANQAEALLREATQLNAGEAEFWAYLGFCLYMAHGQASLDEARQCLQKSLKIQEKLDVAHEFLGRIEHAEGNVKAALMHLNQALELNARNTAAEREIRLIHMRQPQGQSSASKSLLNKLLQR